MPDTNLVLQCLVRKGLRHAIKTKVIGLLDEFTHLGYAVFGSTLTRQTKRFWSMSVRFYNNEQIYPWFSLPIPPSFVELWLTLSTLPPSASRVRRWSITPQTTNSDPAQTIMSVLYVNLSRVNLTYFSTEKKQCVIVFENFILKTRSVVFWGPDLRGEPRHLPQTPRSESTKLLNNKRIY